MKRRSKRPAKKRTLGQIIEQPRTKAEEIIASIAISERFWLRNFLETDWRKKTPTERYFRLPENYLAKRIENGQKKGRDKKKGDTERGD